MPTGAFANNMLQLWESCGKQCSCQKAGMKCLKSCKECLRVTCENTLTELFESSLEVDDGLGLDGRHFLI